MTSSISQTEIAKAEKRLAQAKARLQSLKARESVRARKIDARRKIILGGALIDLAARDDGASAMVERLIRNLSRVQDQKAFADWDGVAAQSVEE